MPAAGPAAAEAGRASGAAGVASASSLDAMLALQEDRGGEAAGHVRDREARRRGHGLLAALAALQHALLGGGDAEAALHELAGLTEGPPAASAGLEAVVRGLSLRAQIELARRGL